MINSVVGLCFVHEIEYFLYRRIQILEWIFKCSKLNVGCRVWIYIVFIVVVCGTCERSAVFYAILILSIDKSGRNWFRFCWTTLNAIICSKIQVIAILTHSTMLTCPNLIAHFTVGIRACSAASTI